MSCPHIAETIANYFEEFLSPGAKQKQQQHLTECPECRREIAALNAVPAMLGQWQRQSVPDWDRSAIMRPQASRKPLSHRHTPWLAGLSRVAGWAPLIASMILAVAVITQTRLEVTASGWVVSFGGSVASQQADTRAWVEAALRSHGEATADNVYQWMTWMEQQRELDLQRMETGFQQLLDRDFQTVDSVRQLASYVMYQETP